MNLIEAEQRRIRATALVGAVGVMLAVVMLFHLPPVPPAGSPGPSGPMLTFRQLGKGGEADFYDPTPLFLPSRWSARPQVEPEDLAREPGDDFRYGPRFSFDVNSVRLKFPAPAHMPSGPGEVLEGWAADQPFLGLGQRDVNVPALENRMALVQVVATGDGRVVFRQVLATARPPGNGDWQPMEYLVAVDPMGLAGLPVPVPGSNSVEAVTYFQNYLAAVLKVGARLAPGNYRIKVGP